MPGPQQRHLEGPVAEHPGRRVGGDQVGRPDHAHGFCHAASVPHRPQEVPTKLRSVGNMCRRSRARPRLEFMTMGEPKSERRIRIGIDTGGTFTDVVAFDEDTGELVTTKTPSTPANPADGFMAGVEKVLGILDAAPEEVTAVSHGTTVATNQLLEGKVERLGFITNTGYEAMLEIARQSVPDGYGNSYFWVKPDRIVPRHLVKGVDGRLDFTGAEVRPFDEAGAREVARWFADRGIDTLGVCFLHAYANPAHEVQMRAVLAEEHPEAVVSLSSEVLREYREYERAMTTLVDAAVKPRLSAYVANIAQRLAADALDQVPGHDPVGLDPEVGVAVAVRHRLAGDLKHRLVAGVGDEAEPLDVALQQLVGRHRGAVADRGDRVAPVVELAETHHPEHLLDARHEPVGGIGRRRRRLGGDQLTAVLVEGDDVGEGAAGVDPDPDAAVGRGFGRRLAHGPEFKPRPPRAGDGTCCRQTGPSLAPPAAGGADWRRA